MGAIEMLRPAKSLIPDTTTKINIYGTSFMTLYKQCHSSNIIECTMTHNLKRHNLVYFF